MALESESIEKPPQIDKERQPVEDEGKESLPETVDGLAEQAESARNEINDDAKTIDISLQVTEGLPESIGIPPENVIDQQTEAERQLGELGIEAEEVAARANEEIRASLLLDEPEPSPPENNETPFNESLEPTNSDSRMVEIRELKSRADIFVREHELEEGEDLNEIIKSYSEGKKLFEKMSSEHGIRIVSMDSVVGKNEEGKTAVFTIVDKIEGEDLSKIESLPAEAEEELNALYCSLGQHYHDAWKKGDKYWADGNNSQFMYGHKHGEEDDHFFLVDVDARFLRQDENELFAIEWLVHNICDGLVEAESKFQTKTRLKESRKNLLGIISEMQEDKPDDEWLLKAKNILEA